MIKLNKNNKWYKIFINKDYDINKIQLNFNKK